MWVLQLLSFLSFYYVCLSSLRFFGAATRFVKVAVCSALLYSTLVFIPNSSPKWLNHQLRIRFFLTVNKITFFQKLHLFLKNFIFKFKFAKLLQFLQNKQLLGNQNFIWREVCFATFVWNLKFFFSLKTYFAIKYF